MEKKYILLIVFSRRAKKKKKDLMDAIAWPDVL